MKSRISDPQQRGLRNIDALRLGHTEPDTRVLACLLSLICGAMPSTKEPTTGGAIRFRPGSARLDASARAALRRWAVALRGEPGIRILIGGFTSQLHFAPDAMGLALRRVDAIRAYLRSREIGVNRIEVAVCGTGWFLVERIREATHEELSGRCLLEIVDPKCAQSRN